MKFCSYGTKQVQECEKLSKIKNNHPFMVNSQIIQLPLQLGGLFPFDFSVKKRRYALILYVRSLRNFKNKGNKRGRNGLHALRGAVIPTSVSKGFLRACTLRSVAYSSTLSILSNPYFGTV